jgi:hypothetical protein
VSDAAVEKAISMATLALRNIAECNDCDYVDAPHKARPRPCPCSKCVAANTLVLITDGPGNWRYRGAHADRTQTMPRERKIIEAWADQVKDRELGQILTELSGHPTFHAVEEPSVRDWHVATSVVQWLATNVGMEVLRRAGFEYKTWDEDRRERGDR